MPRVKSSSVNKNKHKKIIKLAKGYKGRRKNVFKIAKQAVLKALIYSYRDRRNKKRVFKKTWIVNINNYVRTIGVKYSTFIYIIKEKQIIINKHILWELTKTLKGQSIISTILKLKKGC